MELISKKTFQFILLILMNFYEPIYAQLNLTNEKDNFLTENEIAFKDGEWLEFRVHYGIFNASYITLSLTKEKLNGSEVLHSKGYGKTTGLLRLFFRVEDIYESYFEINRTQPIRFIRKIDEGGYTKNTIIDFDIDNQKAFVNDIKNGKESIHKIEKKTQDLISTFYYLRNYFPDEKIKINESFDVNIFFDEESYIFNLKFLGIELLDTKFGKIECLKFTPIVQTGRVFKEEESVTLWVSNDKNKIPIRIQANIAVGSIKCDLENFRNLKYPFKIRINENKVFNNFN